MLNAFSKGFVPALILLAASSAGAQAAFIPLGDLPGGGTASRATGISADGSVVVGLATTGDGREAFVWDAERGLRGLGDLPGGIFRSEALAISGDGSTVVGRSDSENGSEAFAWDAENGLRGLGDFAGGVFTSGARAVSLDGSTIVGFGSSEAGREAFVWRDDTGLRRLGDLSDDRFGSDAFGVSADGSTIVGTSETPAGPAAFVWNEAAGFQSFAEIPTDQFDSRANAVSPDGSTVLGRSVSEGLPLETGTAFGWNAEDGLETLDPLGRRGRTEVFAASTDGSILVGTDRTASFARPDLDEAVVWDAAHGARALSVLLDTLGIDLDGWRLNEATAVSADGRVIAGVGTNRSGQREAFLAIVPEPNAALLLGLGLGWMGWTRGRA